MMLNDVFKNNYPECYIPEENNPYPLCQGSENSTEFVDNNCIECCLYVEYDTR